MSDLQTLFDDAGHDGPVHNLDCDYIIRRGSRIRARRQALVGGAAALGVGVAALVGGAVLRDAGGSAAPSATIRPSQTPISIATSSWKPGDPANLARQEGILTATASQCLYLRNTHGELATGGLVWPAGYTAREVDGSIEVARPDGVVVAKTGQRLVVGGGFGDSDSAVCPGIGAGPNDVFYVTAELPLQG
jgi:hypothetical protein